MNFLPTRSYSSDHLQNFIDNHLKNYAHERNYDYGENNRENISCLSPYISHGVIQEKEILKQSLKKYPFDAKLLGKEDRYWAKKIIKNKLRFLYDPLLEAEHHYTDGGSTWKIEGKI